MKPHVRRNPWREQNGRSPVDTSQPKNNPVEVKDEEKEIWLRRLSENGLKLELSPEKFRDDPLFVEAAIINNYHAFLFASKRIQSDREFVFRMIQGDYKGWMNHPTFILAFATREIRKDRGFVKMAVRKFHESFRFADYSLKKDRNFVSEIIQMTSNGISFPSCIIQFVDDSLKNDRELVLEAVRQNGLALNGAGEDLKNDKVVVIEAIRTYPKALKFASKELRKDLEFCEKCKMISKDSKNYVIVEDESIDENP